MRRITAHYIFPVSGKPMKHGIIELDDAGTITKLIDTNGQLSESAGLEHYSGVLVAGFVNAHCHLELSHMLGVVPKSTGLPGFVGQIVDNRNTSDAVEQTKQAANADAQMYASGISAVGDICNLPLTFTVKAKSQMHYSNFVELIGITEAMANTIFVNGLEVIDEAKAYIKQKNRELSDTVSAVPHAPYSVSGKLMKRIWAVAENEQLSTTVHNQETETENSLFTSKSGELYEVLSSRGVPYANFEPSGKSSLQTMLPHMPKSAPVLLVHNTFTKTADIATVKAKGTNAWFCLCPNANLYIENRLPQIDMLHSETTQICLGTDSLASNDQLSILEEMKTIQQHFPDIPFEKLLEWASLNGAKALQIDALYGSLELGKQPGLVLLENFDFENMTVKAQTSSRRIV